MWSKGEGGGRFELQLSMVAVDEMCKGRMGVVFTVVWCALVR